MSAKDEILARVRRALRDVPAGVPVEVDAPVTWQYRQPVEVGDLLEAFATKVADYRATVVRCPLSEVPAEIARALSELGVGSVVLPSGLEGSWRDAIGAAGISMAVDEAGQRLSHNELNATGAVVTAAAVGAAETGTIVLDHAADQGRRALSLVPDVHICVVRADQVVSGVPEAVARVKPAVQAGQPLTWISGGSATCDIELRRVEGVHGPRILYVIIGE